MSQREDELRAVAEGTAGEIMAEDMPDFVEILLNVLAWRYGEDDEDRCRRYDALVAEVIAHIEKGQPV